MKICSILVLIAVTFAPGAHAQNGAPPTSEALALARTLVAESDAGGENALSGLRLPVADYLHELGVKAPDHVRALSKEVVMQALGDHSDDLTDIQVKSYATLLTVTEMKAAIAFYDSPTGRNFVKFRYRRVQADLPEGAALISQLRPEIQLRAGDVAHAHGWPPPPG